jgi:hypothetical protein
MVPIASIGLASRTTWFTPPKVGLGSSPRGRTKNYNLPLQSYYILVPARLTSRIGTLGHRIEGMEEEHSRLSSSSMLWISMVNDSRFRGSKDLRCGNPHSDNCSVR